MLKTIDQFDLKEKRLFIRSDFNVSLVDGNIIDDTRIRESLPTIEWAISHGAKIILASHLGRPKGQVKKEFSLLPVARRLTELLMSEVTFPENCVGGAVKKLVSDLREGHILLLENLRFHQEEENNDPFFAKQLASLAQVYINDAFGTSHRSHASTVGMVEFFTDKGIGMLMKKEIEYLDPLIHAPKRPFLAILGGAKVSDKIGVMQSLLGRVDALLIGGGMAYTFLKAQGFDVGASLVEPGKIKTARMILEKARLKNVKIVLPVDSVIASHLSADDHRIASHDEQWHNWMGLDIGPATLGLFEAEIKKAKTIFWNGPMGVFEKKSYQAGTFEIARMIAECNCLSVAGGGDSLAAINQSGYEKKFTHLSTGGGASLEYLEGITLPGLKALET